MMKKYLVTGGAGFIGTNFVKYILAAHGADAVVSVVDSLTYAGNIANLDAEIASGAVNFVKADIRDAEAMTEIMADAGPDYIVNFAAESHVDRSIDDPAIFVSTNVMGTQTLLEAFRRHIAGSRPGERRFLQVSTDEVYGALEKDRPEGMPLAVSDAVSSVVGARHDATAYGTGLFTETTPLRPRSPYSASKASADMLVRAYHETYGLPVLITRCSNNYGPYQFPEKLIPLIINNIIHGRPLPVYGDGTNVRDWLYVDDHAAAIDAVLRRGRVGEAYNIGGFNEHTNIEIVRTVIDIITRLVDTDSRYAGILKCPREAVGHKLIKFVTDRPGHDMRYAINPEKIATELGWLPLTPFSEGIEKTVRWYLDNLAWVDSVTSGEYRDYYNRMYGSR